MAINGEFLLWRMVYIQELTRKHTKNGATQEFIFKEYIQPLFGISKSTYYRYLSTSAKRELADMDSQYTGAEVTVLKIT